MFTDNLFHRAQRIALAKLPEYYAVLASDIQPLPHQLDGVYHNMLSRRPLRFLLADDTGAGKTIMTGLLIQEMFIRKQLTSCIIIAPGSLAEQWQDELAAKFHMDFSIFPEVSNSPFTIARLDTLARNETLQQKISNKRWNLAVIDEAHKLSVQEWNNEIYYTKRSQLGRRLSKSADNLLMLTATPHNGKSRDFQLFMEIITGSQQSQQEPSQIMRRLLKEDLITFTGEKLLPEREAFTVKYTLSAKELALYDRVSSYVRNEFNRADKLAPKLRHSIGFALTILQRRLASSPEAICSSLRRRLDRLSDKLAHAQHSGTLAGEQYDLTDDDTGTAADFLTASQTVSDLKAEINTLSLIAQQAEDLRNSGQDTKWQALSNTLQHDPLISAGSGKRRKLIIFTEHRDTLNYLAQKISNLTGSHDSVITIHGGLSRSERRRAEYLFMNDDNVHILIATDAAGEGINLQCTNFLINYDLPWNPNRLEQRFGRIHRIGQHKKCMFYNLVAVNTREGQVFDRLLSKLDEERRALGGQVFDVLGSIAPDGFSLSDLLLDAVRNDRKIDFSHSNIAQVISEHSRSIGKISTAYAQDLKRRLDKCRAELLHPKVIEAFFVEAFTALGGRIFPREKGTYEILYVPPKIRHRDSRIAGMYHRICFDPKFHAQVILQGHPLLNAVISLVIEKFSCAEDVDDENDSMSSSKDIELAAMNAVMKIERDHGNSPRDVSSLNLGYDIESESSEGTLRFIEVKGRRKGARTVTITAAEIRSILNNPVESILALVIVDGDNTYTRYLMHPFKNEPDDSAVSITFGIAGLVKNSECIYEM